MSVFNQSRSYIIRLIFVGIFLIIIAQLFNLQVVSSKYQKLAQDNAVFPKVIYPPRGIVYDRKSKAIVTNVMMYDLMVTPAEAKGLDTTLLCRLLEIDVAEFKTRILNAIFKNGRYRPSALEPLLTPEKYARLQENIWRFNSGVFLQERPIRTYPYNVGAHFMGYIGEADSAIIARSKGFYQPGDYVGRSGIEAYYEKILMGQRGVQFLIKDNKNRLVGSYEDGEFDTAFIAGRGLHSYIDVEVQQLAEKLLTNKMGAIVALEPKTGGIIALASSPSFSPDALTGFNFKKNYGKLVLDASSPLLNRAIKGQYPAGSTYKPLEALIGLNEGVITPASGIGCSGAYYACNRPVRCTEHWAGHASNLRMAIAHSCNSFFSNTYRLIVDNPKYQNVKVGYMHWKNYMNAFGYGIRLGVDLPSEDRGNIPDTSVYNKEYNNQWNSCTNVTLGIGQDKMLVTPLQMANGIAIVANKGYYYIPHFVKSIDGETKEDSVLTPFRTRHNVLTHISNEDFETVISGMQDVVDAGTGRVAKIPGINVCAKTGTAENFAVIKGKRTQLKDNGLFVCFAPREDPKIVVAVIVENSGFGATYAAPIASLLVEKYLTDSLRPDSKKKADRIAGTSIIPPWVALKQYEEDMARDFQWFKMTKDSNYIKKYLHGRTLSTPGNDSTSKKPLRPKQPVAVTYKSEIALPDERYIISKRKTPVA